MRTGRARRPVDRRARRRGDVDHPTRERSPNHRLNPSISPCTHAETLYRKRIRCSTQKRSSSERVREDVRNVRAVKKFSGLGGGARKVTVQPFGPVSA
ncbi:hypothetical protein EVAR_23811_1 [Eumeta japonica]|uniref:Uncharacterized protein n=1 Tax=Eumeta variegata TaxID=151549 RepID=A0A4C1VLQ7_EUMVA|nr:hypothetical protein EVAR_23811_1 [Eumeta japonica]